MTIQKKVVIRWQATGLSADPETIRVDTRCESLRWELDAISRSARIVDVTFEAGGAGPFDKVGPLPSSDLWQGEGSALKPPGVSYKYSVFVTDANGVVLELDPFVVDTDKP